MKDGRAMVGALSRILTIIFVYLQIVSGLAQSPGEAIKLRLEKDTDSLHIRLRNSSANTVLVNLGSVAGTEAIPAIRLDLHSCKKNGSFTFISRGGATSVRGEPWVIVLPSSAEYSLVYPLKGIISREGLALSAFVGSNCELTAHLKGTSARDRKPGGAIVPYSLSCNGPTNIPFWEGLAESTLSLQ